ncbi:Similar to Son: Protein Son (Drosophila melanogaster) [Cotesia congregata]|uniref:Similar to Son: Protein Son (Drosophila melanogaster) n=1 Tax=Cotesia congregata TaxID=51543 RepID=A0A8J2HH00_COTCN|nr:Similar to Son: Protein Son (Drosophila melanogaster) [Cotesia congregata]
MADLFDLANLITNVGVDAVKIKQEPDMPEKSSNQILTELFSTFDVDEGIESPVNDEEDDDDSNDGDDTTDKVKKKKKKSKKKHKHKDKKHKKRSRKNSSDSGSECEVDGVKKKKKHKKKLKRKKSTDLSDSSNSDEPKVKIKKELLSPENTRKNKIDRALNFKIDHPQTVFDLVSNVVSKKEQSDKELNDGKLSALKSPELPPFSKKVDDESEPVAPRLLEKTDQPTKGKILIKDLKNSLIYNETVKEVENKKKEKAARMEDGEISDSNSENRTPTLSPSPQPQDSFDSIDDTVARSSHQVKDLRLVLKHKEKIKKSRDRKGSREDRESRSHNDETKDRGRSHHHDRKDKHRSTSSHSKDRKSESTHSHSRRRSRSRGWEHHRTRSNERRYRDRSTDRRSTRSRERSRYSNGRCRSEDKGWDRSFRGRSRSKERKERIEIDKKKLLEIARKNAINMIKRGALPLAQQDKAIAAIQAGGKSVDELIDFCKSLSKSEALGELSSVSSDEGASETEKGFHHPFLLKERPNSIIMNIRDSKQLPTKTFQERTTESSTQLRLQFPVSSGQQHRKTENEWIDVTPVPPVKKPEPKKPFVSASVQVQTPAFTIIPPINTQLPAANAQALVPVSLPAPTPVPAPVQTVTTAPAVAVAPIPTPVPPVAMIPAPVEMPTIAQPMLQAPANSVFPQPPAENIDIGTIVSQRLAAMRKLKENPNDVQALNEIYQAQNEMKTWAESKQMPGQFTGSTGVKVLSAAELTSGYQTWARKDQLTSATPVSGGMGMALLQKMGWRPGEGLGKNKEGTLEPLQLEIKLDKRGLVSHQDVGVRTGKNPGKPVVPTIKTLEGKHPVSLLGEYCSKRKFGAPVYELCFECGPDHKKNFLFKVKVNGIEYKPSVASPNKKQAKAEAAQICLQTLGLLPT